MWKSSIDGKMERDMNRQVGASFAVMWALLQVGSGKELS